jgi:hypothetical protein
LPRGNKTKRWALGWVELPLGSCSFQVQKRIENTDRDGW